MESKPSRSSSDIIDMQADLARMKDRTSRLENKGEQSETEIKELEATLRVQTSRIGKNEQNLVRIESELRAEIAGLSAEVTQRLLAETLDDAAQQQMIEDFIQKVGSSS